MRWPWTKPSKASLLDSAIDRHLLGDDWNATDDDVDTEIADLMRVVDSLRDAWSNDDGDATLRSRVWLRVGSHIAAEPETRANPWRWVTGESPAVLTAMGWTSIVSSGGMLTLAAVGAR
jgi:hypothetical protein